MNFQKEEQLDIEYLEEKANYFDEKIRKGIVGSLQLPVSC